MEEKKSKIIISNILSIIQIVLGALGALFFGLTLIVGFTSSPDIGFGIAMLIVTALFVWLLVAGIRRRKLNQLFRLYTQRLAGDPTRSIQKLATTVNTSLDVVVKNLDKMIHRGFFVNAYIDHEQNRVIFQSQKAPSQSTAYQTASVPAGVGPAVEPAVEYTTVTCKGCGATNQIVKGAVGECEFCGSKIK